MLIEPIAQPRIDTLTRRVDTGAECRETEYAGAIWVAGRAAILRVEPPR